MGADLVIVGGGPAGLAAAICGAQRGLAAVVVDHQKLPLDKACGEGLMPAGVAALAAMRVEVPARARAPFVGIRYLEEGRVAEARFTAGAGWGVRRTALIESMAARARAVGVELRYGCKATGWEINGDGITLHTQSGPVAAALLVGADGLHSWVRRQAGLACHWRGPLRFGVRRHFACAPWSQFVEVHWAGGAEAYVTPTGPQQVGVAILWSGKPRTFDDLLGDFPRLGDHLADAQTTSRSRGAGPFRQGVSRRWAERLALIGDAAGYLDPLTGEGLTLSFECARILADTVAQGLPLRRYDEAYRRLTFRHYQTARLVLLLHRWPRVRRATMFTLARTPRLFGRLLDCTVARPCPAGMT